MKVSDGPITEARVVALPWNSFPSESTIFSDRFKRLFDVSLSMAAAIMCTPIILFCCLLILAESRGCPIYRQKRVGKNGKPYYIVGPHDSPARCERIVAQLTRRLGSQGFQILMPIRPDFRISSATRAVPLGIEGVE